MFCEHFFTKRIENIKPLPFETKFIKNNFTSFFLAAPYCKCGKCVILKYLPMRGSIPRNVFRVVNTTICVAKRHFFAV